MIMQLCLQQYPSQMSNVPEENLSNATNIFLKKSSSVCHQFSRLIDANTQLLSLLNEAGSDSERKKDNVSNLCEKIKVKQPNFENSFENDHLKRKKFRGTSIDKEAPDPFSHFVGPSYISAKLVLEKINDECKDKGHSLAVLVSSYLEVGIKNIAIQFVNGENYKKVTNELATLIEVLLAGGNQSALDISQVLLSNCKIENLPLFAIWKFSKLHVLSFEKILNRIKDTQKVSLLLKDALHLIFEDKEAEEDNVEILKSFISTLITISYCLSNDSYSSLQDCSNKLLTDLPKSILDYIEKNLFEDNNIGESTGSKSFINIYEIILTVPTIDANALEQFLSNQLVILLTYKPEIPVSLVIKEQEKWRSTRINKAISKIMFSIIVGIGHTLAFNTLDSVVSSLEVNWIHILTFLSTLLLSHPESATKLREVIDCYLRKGCSAYEMEFLILGFLFARHASQEGRHIFPSYSNWFGAAFGLENLSPANNKISFMFLFEFLTNLVPYETPTRLRAHVHQSIFVPKGCQKILRDYQHLARAQIQHLTNQVDPVFDENGENNTDPACKSKVHEDINSATEQFEKFGKVPSFLIEASIFKRPYYLNSFLPLLLKPRELPSKPDSKMKLIEELLQLDKIPKKVYSAYLDQCESAASTCNKVENENVNLDSEPLTKLNDALNTVVRTVMQDRCQLVKSSDNLILELLSQLSNQLEDLTALADLKFTNVSCLTIDVKEYNSNLLLYQVVHTILESLKRIVNLSEENTSEEISRQSNNFAQLLSLMTVSPALQQALIITLLNHLETFGDKFSLKMFQFYGLLLLEFKKIEGMFLCVKTYRSDSEEACKIIDFIIKKLPMDSTKHCLLSCFILSALLEWSQHEGEPAEKFQEVYSVYACLAGRLVAMETEWNQMDVEVVSSKNLKSQTGFAINKVPSCCKLFLEQKQCMNNVKLLDWVNFELRTPWGGTPLITKIRHLQYWFYTRQCGTGTDEKCGNGFLNIFWLLQEEHLQSENSAEMLILLQSLLSSGNYLRLSLLEEWKNWKRSKFLQKECKSDNVYQVKLLQFMSLCRCLPSDKFFSKSNLLQSSSFLKELVLDLLGCEGTLYLSFGDTLYLFEALLKAGQEPDITTAQIQQCFHPIKDSVIFHWRHLKLVTPAIEPTFQDRFIALKSLSKINPEEPPSWKSLTPNDFGIVFLSTLFCNDDKQTVNRSMEAIDNNNQLMTMWRCISYFGNVKINSKESLMLPDASCSSDKAVNNENDVLMISDDENDHSRKVSLVNKNYEFDRILSVCLFLLEQIDLTDPTKILATFKTESGQVPIAWISTLVGLVFVLLNILRDAEIETENSQRETSQRVASLFSLLICCFNYIAKLFDANDSEFQGESSLSYISQLNQRIHSLIQTLPKTILVSIPMSVVNQCDSEIKNSFNWLKMK